MAAPAIAACACLHAAPRNDAFAEREIVWGNAIDVAASNVGATAEPGEPGHARSSASRSVWWSWTPTQSGIATLSTRGSDFDTRIAVYHGSDFGSLVSVTAGDDTSSGTTSHVAFAAEAFTTYWVAVDGFAGAVGSIRLRGAVSPGETLLSDSFATRDPGVDQLGREDGWDVVFGRGASGITDAIPGRAAYIGNGAPAGRVVAVRRELDFNPIQSHHPWVHGSMDLLLTGSAPTSNSSFMVVFYSTLGGFLAGVEFDPASRSVRRVDGRETWPTGVALASERAQALAYTINFAANTWSATLDGRPLFEDATFHAGSEDLDLGSLAVVWTGEKPESLRNTALAFGKVVVTAKTDSPVSPIENAVVQTKPDGTLVSWPVVETGGTYQVWRVCEGQESTLVVTTAEHQFLDTSLEAGRFTCYRISDVDGRTLALAERSVMRNVSVRGDLSPGNPILLGFVLGGTSEQDVLVRAIGPGLSAFGVDRPIQQPTLTLRNSAANEAEAIRAEPYWKLQDSGGRIAIASASVGAFPLDPDSADTAVATSLPPGIYNAQMNDRLDREGTGLCEVYFSTGSGNAPTNISIRGRAGTNADALIAGIHVSGTSPIRVLIRGIGRGLESFGVAGSLSNAALTVVSHGTLETQQTNDDWSAGPATEVAAIQAAERTCGAFPLAPEGTDAAMLFDLTSGAHTIQLTPAPGSPPGVGLIEVFRLD